MNPLKPRPLARSQSCPDFTTSAEPKIRFEKPAWDNEIIDSYEASPNRRSGVGSISSAAEFRQWLTDGAKRVRASNGDSKILVEERRKFITYARQSIANSAMDARERTLALNALKEVESIFDKP